MATILIVEDNPTNMTLATFLLESAGHTVLTRDQRGGRARRSRATQHPDLILMDIQLPGHGRPRGHRAAQGRRGDARRSR